MKKHLLHATIFASGIAAGFVTLVVSDVVQQVRWEKSLRGRTPATVTDIRDAQ